MGAKDYKEVDNITFKCLFGKALNAAANGYARKSDSVYWDSERRNIRVRSYWDSPLTDVT